MRLDVDRLLDMLEAIDAIERHRARDWDAFDSDELVRVWCLRHIEILGEAAARVSKETRALSSGIPWGQIVGMRNALIHANFNVDWPAVWLVVDRDLPPLNTALRALLKDLGDRV